MPAKLVDLIAWLVRVAGLVIVLILVAQIAFLTFGANPANGGAMTVDAAAKALTLGLTDVFRPQDPTLAPVAAYGVPALVWLVLTVVVSRLIRRIAVRSRSSRRAAAEPATADRA